MSASPEEIRDILYEIRKAIDSHKIIPINRQDNINTLTSLGITWHDAIDEIYFLTEEDYISGPEIDRDYPKTDFLWKFHKVVFEQLIYIKIKVLYQKKKQLKILSFHIDRFK